MREGEYGLRGGGNLGRGGGAVCGVIEERRVGRRCVDVAGEINAHSWQAQEDARVFRGSARAVDGCIPCHAEMVMRAGRGRNCRIP